MKYWFRLLMLVGAVLGVVALIGSLLPRDYDFATQVRINSEPAAVFGELNRIASWREWSQWNPAEIDGLTVSYSGPASGVGATQSWSDVRGDGKLWFTSIVENKRIDYAMLFGGFPKMSSSLQLTEEKAGTIVVWSSKGRLPGGPFYGFLAPFFSTHMKSEYDKSLLKLKQKLESKKVENRSETVGKS